MKKKKTTFNLYLGDLELKQQVSPAKKRGVRPARKRLMSHHFHSLAEGIHNLPDLPTFPLVRQTTTSNALKKYSQSQECC